MSQRKTPVPITMVTTDLPVRSLLFRQLPIEIDNSVREWEQGMPLVLKGGEFIATDALSVTLSRLMVMAQHRPLFINGMELCQLDLAKLVEEAQSTGKPVWLNRRITLPAKN